MRVGKVNTREAGVSFHGRPWPPGGRQEARQPRLLPVAPAELPAAGGPPAHFLPVLCWLPPAPPALFFSAFSAVSPHPAAPKCQPCFLASTKTHLPWGLGSLEDRGGVLGGLCAPHLSLSSLSFSEVRGSVCSPPSLPHILGTAILVTPEHS